MAEGRSSPSWLCPPLSTALVTCLVHLPPRLFAITKFYNTQVWPIFSHFIDLGPYIGFLAPFCCTKYQFNSIAFVFSIFQFIVYFKKFAASGCWSCKPRSREYFGGEDGRGLYIYIIRGMDQSGLYIYTVYIYIDSTSTYITRGMDESGRTCCHLFNSTTLRPACAALIRNKMKSKYGRDFICSQKLKPFSQVIPGGACPGNDWITDKLLMGAWVLESLIFSHTSSSVLISVKLGRVLSF